MPYATADAVAAGPDAVLREVKTMVRDLHAAGIEVILDVVYNHTSELGLGGPRSSFRGIDNRGYYRQQDDGAYIDVTGCGNAVNTATAPPRVSCWTPCGTGPTTCRSTVSASTWP
jgi:glycogen operon protein